MDAYYKSINFHCVLNRHINDLVAAKESLETRLGSCILPDDRKHSRSLSCVSGLSFSSTESGSLPRLYSNANHLVSAAAEGSNGSSSPSPEPSDHLENIQAMAYQKGMDTGLQYNLANLKQREKECAAKCRSLSSTGKRTNVKPLWSQLITVFHIVLLFLFLVLLILSCIGTFVWINDDDRSVYCSPRSHYDRYPLPYYFLQFLGIDMMSISV